MILFYCCLGLLADDGQSTGISQADRKAEAFLHQTIFRYERLESFRAKLVVTTNFADTEIRQEGSLLFKKGGMVILRLRDQENKTWLALLHSDGKDQYQYEAKEKRITRRKLDTQSAAQTPYFFPGFERYDLASTRLEETTRSGDREMLRISVALKGATERSAFHFARLLVRESTQVIEEMEYLSAARRPLMRIRFTDLALDEPMKAEQFTWEKPADLSDVPVVDLPPDKRGEK
jgi:outer membrane lipoprotein-sorting protein